MGPGDTVIGYPKRLLDAFRDHQRLGKHPIADARALRVELGARRAARVLGQLHSLRVVSAQIRQHCLGEREAERGDAVTARQHLLPRRVQHPAAFVEAARQKKVVEQRRAMTRLQRGSDTVQRERAATRVEPQVGREAEHPRDAEEHA